MISIKLDDLRAVALAMGKDETKPNIRGVYVEFVASGLYIVATDGFRLHAARVDGEFSTPPVPSFFMPRLFIWNLCELKKVDVVQFEIADSGEEITAYWGDGYEMTSKLPKVVFPDYRVVLSSPRVAHIPPGIWFDARLLRDAESATCLFIDRFKKICPTFTEGPALFYSRSDRGAFVSAVMPYKVTRTEPVDIPDEGLFQL